jgi:hypothetical protein
VDAVSVWSTKSRSICRFIASRAGITQVTADKNEQRINMPSTPYRMRVTTARSHNKTMELLNDLRGDLRGEFLVGTYGAERTEDFIVSMTLETFAPLLEAHYENVVLPRVQRGE